MASMGDKMAALWLSSMQPATNIATFGDKMTALWAENKRTVSSTRAEPPGSFVTILANNRTINYNQISNDATSRAHIENILRTRGITHKPTFDNLVFDYLNTPVGIRDEVMNQNIVQVQEQIVKRTEQIQLQQKVGQAVGSFDVIESQSSFAGEMAALWRSSMQPATNTVSFGDQMQALWAKSDESDGYLESLERRVNVLERQMGIGSAMTQNADGRLERLEQKICALEAAFGIGSVSSESYRMECLRLNDIDC